MGAIGIASGAGAGGGRGRARRDECKRPVAWPSDRIQVLAYGMLLEENTGAIVEECRIRYHADNVVVSLVLDDAGRAEVRAAVQRARELRASLERPPVTTDERKCVR